MSEIIDETINKLNKPTQNNVFSIEDDPVTVLEKINQVERYLKQIDTSVDTSINTANEALEKANNAFEANGTLVKINGENQLTWSADFAESERQKSKNLFNYEDIIPTTGLTTDNNGTFYIDTTIYYVVRQLNIPFELNKTYTMSGNVVSITGGDRPTFEFAVKYKDGEWVSYASNVITGAGIVSASFTPTKEVDLFELRFVRQNTVGQELQATINNLQLEEGSTATDYQPYNGAIVHEKDIEPILIYDIDTKNTIGGTAYTNGVKFGANTIINVAGYSKIKTYSRVYNTYNITEVVIDKTGWTGNSFMIFGEASAIKNVGMLIYHEGQNITPTECFNFSDGTTLNNNDNAYIYRIEGVK